MLGGKVIIIEAEKQKNDYDDDDYPSTTKPVSTTEAKISTHEIHPLD